MLSKLSFAVATAPPLMGMVPAGEGIITQTQVRWYKGKAHRFVHPCVITAAVYLGCVSGLFSSVNLSALFKFCLSPVYEVLFSFLSYLVIRILFLLVKF